MEVFLFFTSYSVFILSVAVGFMVDVRESKNVEKYLDSLW